MKTIPIQNGEIVMEFLHNNWVNCLLVIVGTFALLTYILQERKKVTEAASLIVLQIDEVQDRIKEIQSYIVNAQLNDTAFYESQILFGEDYWNHYKHYFVRKIDYKSYKTLNSFYDCAAEIRDQQQLMKNLQKNFFFVTQQVFTNMEGNYILSGLNDSKKFPIDIGQVVTGLTQTMPQNLEDDQKEAIENMLHQFATSNGNIDFTIFWNNYNQTRSNLRNIIDQKGLTLYIPLQIRLSLEKALNQYTHLEINGCDGYVKLKKISNRKF